LSGYAPRCSLGALAVAMLGPPRWWLDPAGGRSQPMCTVHRGWVRGASEDQASSRCLSLTAWRGLFASTNFIGPCLTPLREHDVRNRRVCPPSRRPTPRALRAGGAFTRHFPNLTFAVARRHRPSHPVALGQLAYPRPLSRKRGDALTSEPGPPPRAPGERLPQV